MEQIKDGAKIAYPPQMVEHELEHVMEDLKGRLSKQNLDMAAYLKSRQVEEEKFIAEEARPIALKRLERALIMDELAKSEKIEVSQEVLQSTFQQTWGEYQGDAGFQKQLKGKIAAPQGTDERRGNGIGQPGLCSVDPRQAEANRYRTGR